MSTVAELGARLLRKLRIVSIAQSGTPATSGTVTLVEIGLRVLQKLGVLDGAENPEAEDKELSEEKVTAVHQMLLANNRVPWAIGAIPAYAAEQYAIMAAWFCAKEYEAGKVTSPSAEEYALAESQLIAMVEKGTRAQSLAEEKIKAAHYDLVANGKARWTLFDIPVYVEEGLMKMAAYYLGPEFAIPVPLDEYEIGRRMVLATITLNDSDAPTVASYF